MEKPDASDSTTPETAALTLSGPGPAQSDVSPPVMPAGEPHVGSPAPTRAPGRPNAPEDSRRRRGGDRRQAGFGDSVERAYCTRFNAPPPRHFPVQHRTGGSTLRPTVVARRGEEWLLCDGAHLGEHLWPNDEAVLDGEGPESTTGPVVDR